jgi:hypothetical protein
VAHANEIFNVRLGVGGGRGLVVWDENTQSPNGRILAVGTSASP